MKRARTAALRLAAAALLLAALAATGCAVDTASTAPTAPTLTELDGPAPAAVLGFTGTPTPVGKAAGQDRRTELQASGASGPWVDSHQIGPRGGTLKIQDQGRRRDAEGQRFRELIAVDLSVPRGALPEPQTLTMTVTGYWLSELEIAFQPSGLRFDREARLKIHLGRDRVDVDTATLRAYHMNDGTETAEVIVEVEVEGNGDVVIHARVPGFSRYSLGD